MFVINDDLSIYITRGDIAFFQLTAIRDNGESYRFQAGDVVRFKVFEKKACENVAFQKDFGVEEETDVVEILLTENETKIGEVISKPTDYWYEVELNPNTYPQTIIGYDDDGTKLFKLFPEGADVPEIPIDPEEIPVMDDELDLTSNRPVENQAIARAVAQLDSDINIVNARFNNFATLKEGSTTADAELHDIRVGADGEIYGSAGDAVREQFKILRGLVRDAVADLKTPVEQARESAEIAVGAKDAAKVSEENAKASELRAEALMGTARDYNDITIGMIEEERKRLGLADFELDEEGYLNYTDDTAYEFAVDDNGMLNYFAYKKESE